ncbi:glycoside hydrolase 43 family protein [Butyrivibrio sp. YAB3001]|uniref:glycoside hydrolase 43 family protein n=1 Tax=Butyrivibrio sp. YAB3001 TaxID=1520812 RepID=UPI0008F62B9F|nr:glycoside hydrolase 43 family protein [Butyrivibrio sp. YAB3001]SFD05543.1 Beta-xylosidase [Butyrivibrio sp. YAB3001]
MKKISYHNLIKLIIAMIAIVTAITAPLLLTRIHHKKSESITVLLDNINPITRLDYPDPDVIRVGDTYYMVNTTMYFMPGCEILRSYDLVNWEHATYVYDTLDSTAAQKLEGKENIYGQGMWAASLRYHDGIYYVCFVANDTQKTYIYQSNDINGPWEKYNLKGFYHDNSIVFDDDDKIYIVYGNKNIYIKELNLVEKSEEEKKNSAIPTRLSDSEKSDIDGLLLSDSDDVYLGYEGTHFYKIDGKYYLLFIHMPKSTGKRTEAVFVADKPQGPYYGKDVMDDDRNYRRSGVAQGGIVDTPSGRWYSILFQDSGSVGRIPILIPVTWEKTDGEIAFPVFGDNGLIPEEFEIEDLKPGYEYTPLVSSDDFKTEYKDSSSFGFKPCWQFNHEPDLALIKRDLKNGAVSITTDKISNNLVQAKNTMTQRALFPGCEVSVTIDASDLNDGDYAGLCMLESNYGLIAVTRRDSAYFLVMGKRENQDTDMWSARHNDEPFDEVECIELDCPVVTLHAGVCFDHKTADKMLAERSESGKKPSLIPYSDDTVSFFYNPDADHLKKLGKSHKLEFKLDHFTGARFGLFVYSTKETGGSASFSNFIYE